MQANEFLKNEFVRSLKQIYCFIQITYRYFAYVQVNTHTMSKHNYWVNIFKLARVAMLSTSWQDLNKQSKIQHASMLQSTNGPPANTETKKKKRS